MDAAQSTRFRANSNKSRRKPMPLPPKRDPRAYRICVVCKVNKHLLDFPLKAGTEERHIGCMDCAKFVMKKIHNSPEKVKERKAKRSIGQCASSSRRRSALLRRIPKWANLDAIGAVYRRCRAIQDATGVPMSVDHIVPLQGKHVSGLHVEYNLEILTRKKNSEKNNKFDL